MGGDLIMASFFKGSTLYRQDANGNYRKVNDITPLHHWKLQEETTSLAMDTGLITSNMTNNNALVADTGKINRCYHFQGGTPSYLRSTNLQNSNFTDFSIAFWGKLDGSASEETIILMNDSLNRTLIAIEKRTDNIISFYIRSYDNQTQIAATPSAVSLNTWINIICTFEGDSNTASIYINNALIDSRDNIELSYFYQNLRCNIGVDGLYGQGFNGYLEDVRFYDYAISGH